MWVLDYKPGTPKLSVGFLTSTPPGRWQKGSPLLMGRETGKPTVGDLPEHIRSVGLWPPGTLVLSTQDSVILYSSHVHLLSVSQDIHVEDIS